MPWLPELFSAPVVARVLEQQRIDELVSMPFFAGLVAGEPDALVESFAGEPLLHDPRRGRVRGERAFRAYVEDRRAWLAARNVAVEDVERVVLDEHGFEEVLLHVDGPAVRLDLPFALIADYAPDRRLEELRIYHSGWLLTGRHVNRPPLLQPDPGLRVPDVVATHQQALAAGDAGAIVAAFEPDGHVREPAGGSFVHRGPESLRAFYELVFSNGGGVPLEHCALVDDGRACALEYNIARWGATELAPQAGVAVYERGAGGRLAALRIYDDADPPLRPRM